VLICFAACGSADSSGDAHCVSGYFCDGVGGGACQPKRNLFDTCARDAECISNQCFGGNCF
jgi:hypothetical protein